MADERRTLLLAVSREILDAARADGALSERVFAMIRDTLDVEFLVNYEQTNDGLRLTAAVGLPDGRRAALERLEHGQAFCGLVAAQRAPLTADVDRIAVDPRGALVRALGIRAYLCHPLLGRGGALLGTFSVGSRRRSTFSTADVDFVQTVCHLLGLAWDRQRSEDDLRESEAFNRGLLDGSVDWVIVLDVDGRVLHANAPAGSRSATEHAPPSRGDLWPRLWPESAREGVQRAVERAAAGEVSTFEAPCAKTRGAPTWWEVTVSPVPGPGGGVARLLAIARDVTARRAAEERLQRSHDTFSQLIQNDPFGVYVVDADFRLRQVSAGTRRVFRNVRPLLDRDFAEVLRILWPEPFATEAIGRFRHTLATGERYAAPTIVEHRADIGEVEAYDWRIHRVTLPDGRHGVVCYFYDLTERQKLEAALRESELFYRQTLESIPGMVFTNTPDGACDYVSQQWVDFTGVPAAEQLGDGWARHLHPDDRPRALAAWRAAVAWGGPYDLEYRVRRADGGYEWFKVRGRAIRAAGGAVVRWFGTAVNVDGLKRAEARLQLRERELQALTGALREADRRKDEFLALLAHELRNPLAPIRTGLQILQFAGADEAAARRARTVMERQVEHMVRLVDDLLDVSRISRGKLEIRRDAVNVRDVVQQAVEASRPVIDAGGHALAVSVPPAPLWVHGDLTRLVQVLSNLLNNAAKYTPAGGHIEVAVEAVANGVALRVIDDGAGIAAEMLPRVFDMFVQADRTLVQSHGGLGIGLSLVRKLVEMHGGTATAESAGPGRGSRFTVVLPLVEGPALAPEPEATAPATAASPSRRRILVVDDNEDAAEALAVMLRLLGAEVAAVHDGPAALRLAREFGPDLVFLDIGMPGMDGHEVARQLRGEPALEGVVLVALTGWGSEGDKARSRASGFDRHLVKPVGLREVEEALTSAASRRATG